MLISDGTNAKALLCQRCPCRILNPLKGSFVRKEMFLPHMKKKSETQAPTDGETLNDYWLVHDMYTFENVGFSNAVGNTKYLICADCEIGPIGWQDTQNPKDIYVALDRVRHE
ncbi:hypothetical protein CAPTEDRAFT_1918 [Capitella teleta]|uniref:Guanine nucleotide exchange factor MSS4 n=1 Tax=Capitella teleta TaxID=283909 RepID=R7T8J6_CAPTE|nr:hypothetical protein CAPTEDRAFT_1918 [Capitella teleta]|eukprot:ELT87324.1 hypothetical protein CAPTEDRAFT_1918 [Capitella teleta]